MDYSLWGCKELGTTKGLTLSLSYSYYICDILIYVVYYIYGKGNDNPFQHSCLGNPMDRGAWRAAVHGAAKELDKIYDKAAIYILYIYIYIYIYIYTHTQHTTV